MDQTGAGFALGRTISSYEWMTAARLIIVAVFFIPGMLVACLIAPSLRAFNQAYQFIQEYDGLIFAGVLAIFLSVLFWKRTTTRSAQVAVALTIPLSALVKFLPRFQGN